MPGSFGLILDGSGRISGHMTGVTVTGQNATL